MMEILRKMLYWMKKNWRGVLVALIAVFFLVGTSFFNVAVQEPDFVKWGSPDENANYIFSKLYANTGELTLFEKYNVVSEDIIHPRSVRSAHGVLMPVSFLGIILIFGHIAALTTYKILPFLTPIFASAAIVFFYLLIRELFGKRNALISTILLSVFPVFIYYTARSMFHNALFVSLLVISLFFAYKMAGENKRRPRFFAFSLSHINWKSWLFAALGGGFLGLAVATRMSELLWLIPAFLILWVFNIRKIGITKLVLFLSFAALTLLPVLCWNQILYSSPFYGGYPEMNQSIEKLKDTGEGMVNSVLQVDMETVSQLAEKAKNTVFYFGFNPELSHKMFRHYVVEMFTWWFLFAFLGLFMFLQGVGHWKKKHWAYLCSYLVVSAILIYYYGSWKFHDNPDESSFTIGNSYTRYWLPVYMGALPFVSILIGKFPRQLLERSDRIKIPGIRKKKDNIIKNILRRIAKKRIWAGVISMLLIFFLGYQMIIFVLYGSEEGLVHTVKERRSMHSQYEEILDATPGNAVIITKYHDKVLFPQRKVIVGGLKDRNMIKNYARLTRFIPVYYYNFTLPAKAVRYLNNNKLEKAGLILQEYKHINDTFTLYKLKRRIE